MNPRTFLVIDRYCGKPICAALSLVRRLFGWMVPQRPQVGPVKSFLFIKLIEQGATVLAHPALARAVELAGKENVYFWVFEENRPIMDLLEVIPPENVIAVRTGGFVRMILSLLATVWKVRRLKIDACVDMEFFSRGSAILAFLSGAARRVGMDRFTNEAPYRGHLLTHRVGYSPYLSTMQAYYLMVEAAMEDPSQVPLLKRTMPEIEAALPEIRPTEAELSRLRGLISAAGTAEGPLVLLNANASDLLPLRRWPTERFLDLARRLLDADRALRIGFTGAPSEREAVDALVAQVGSPRVISFAGRTTLRELLVLFTLADVLVTNDSGAGHFAALSDIDAVVLFGPETPRLYGPIGRHAQVIYAGLACSPCISATNFRFSPCCDNRCMQEITVEQVFDVVKTVLARRAAEAVNA